jgi:hypothetical protein
MNKIVLFIVGLSCLLLASCRDDEGYTTGQSGAKSELTIHYTVDNLMPNGSGAATRASVPASDEEKAVNTLRLFFFNPSDDASGVFVESYSVPAEDIAAGQAGAVSVKLTNGSKIVTTNPYVILAVANAPTELEQTSDAALTGMTEQEFILTHKYTTKGALEAGTDTQTATEMLLGYGNYNPMNPANDEGQSMGMVMSRRIVKSASDTSLDLVLSRIVARFDVKNIYGGYNLVSVSIWNAPLSETIWETQSMSGMERTKRFYGLKDGADPDNVANQIVGGLYSMESYVDAPAMQDSVTTCLVIGMQKDEAGAAVQYYRVNVVNNNRQYLKRNKVYSITIARVRTEGALNEQDAVKDQTSVGLDVNVNNWDIDDSGSVIMDNDGNMLAVGTTNLKMEPQGGIYSIQIFAVGQKTLELSKVIIPPTWTAELHGDVLEVSSKPSDIELNGMVELTFGTLKTTVNITQTGNTDQYISLSDDSRQMFESAGGLASTKPVTVTSSGAWTGIIYNSFFQFIGTATPDTIHGVNGSQVFFMTKSPNVDVLPRYSFVQFVLDDNSEESVTLVLGQRGAGGISLLPKEVTNLTFAAGGTNTTPNFNGFTVVTDAESSNKAWEAIVQTTSDPGAFTITNPDGDDKDTQFTVLATPNLTDKERTATIRVQLSNNKAVGKTFTITQAAYKLSVSPTSVSVLPLLGGNSDVVTVTSDTVWVASLSVAGGKATITKTGGTASTTSVEGTTGESFFLTFDPNTTPNVVPTATVTVTAKGTTVKKTVTFTQAQLVPRSFTIRQHYATYNYNDLLPTGNRNATWMYSVLMNSSNFGPGAAVVPTASQISISSTAELAYPKFLDTDGLYWDGIPYSAAYTNNAVTWHNKNSANWVIVVIAYWDEGIQAYMRNLTGNNGYSYTVNSFIPNGTVLTPETAKAYSDTNKRGEKLWNYLMKDGPFTGGTAIDLSKARYIGQNTDSHGQGLTAWPSSMIPVILYNNNRVTVGIDIENRVAIVNDQIFCNNTTTNPFTTGGEKDLFMKNFIAFIINATQYGTDFTNQFMN